ncbi:DoxX family protein [Ilumatobacter coccineus]|uniref:DoxX family protein n=1 Tax=Ilumatobacter coccineus (strain NBRC 103263 / KCTC 29153 / YM16-304) TaxID=1313172 RepID=A0A6C7E582_ILUCY|nr:DoxX family protein [Ilumatobacter coccineus]BAN02007.1 hypothetical protein YM304_16930 [Ilumatobacter coccineus YM16-304]
MIVLWILQGLIAALYLMVSYMKLTRHPHMVESFELFGYSYRVAVFTAVVEIPAALLLIAGIWWPWCAVAGALLVLPTMIGAAVTNLRFKGPPEVLFTLAVIAVLVAVVIVQWGDFTEAIDDANALTSPTVSL